MKVLRVLCPNLTDASLQHIAFGKLSSGGLCVKELQLIGTAPTASSRERCGAIGLVINKEGPTAAM